MLCQHEAGMSSCKALPSLYTFHMGQGASMLIAVVVGMRLVVVALALKRAASHAVPDVMWC